MTGEFKIGDICKIINAGKSAIPSEFNNALCIIISESNKNNVCIIKCFDILNYDHIIWNSYVCSLIKMEE